MWPIEASAAWDSSAGHRQAWKRSQGLEIKPLPVLLVVSMPQADSTHVILQRPPAHL